MGVMCLEHVTESLCQSKFSKSLLFSKIVPLRIQNLTVQRKPENFRKEITTSR